MFLVEKSGLSRVVLLIGIIAANSYAGDFPEAESDEVRIAS